MRVKWLAVTFIILCMSAHDGLAYAAPADEPLRRMGVTLDPSKIKSAFVQYRETMQLAGKPVQDSICIFWCKGNRYHLEWWSKIDATDSINGQENRSAVTSDDHHKQPSASQTTPTDMQASMDYLPPQMRANLKGYGRTLITWFDGKAFYRQTAHNSWVIRDAAAAGKNPLANLSFFWCYGHGKMMLVRVKAAKGQVRSERDGTDVVLNIELNPADNAIRMRFRGANADLGLPSFTETLIRPGGKPISCLWLDGWNNRDGIWFPTKCVLKLLSDNSTEAVLDEPRETSTYEVLEARFNQPLTEKELNGRIAEGGNVTDYRFGTPIEYQYSHKLTEAQLFEMAQQKALEEKAEEKYNTK